MRLVRVPAGTFRMGCTAPAAPKAQSYSGRLVRQEESDPDEFPVHEVTITRPFSMGATAVTWEQYHAFDPGFTPPPPPVGISQSPISNLLPASPAFGMSWEDAAAFCRWLSEREGLPFRLPTEAEWEYACRAGSERSFHSGEAPPAPGAANTWGLVDMHHGAGEWCADWYGPYPAAAQVDPVGPERGIARVVRGGGIVDPGHPAECPFYRRSANRGGALPGVRSCKAIGFRVVVGRAPETTPRGYEVPGPFAGVRQGGQNCKLQIEKCKLQIGKAPRGWFEGPTEVYPEGMGGGGGTMLRGYCHSPALAVCPNGDLLTLAFDGPNVEFGPGVCLVGTRRRAGSREWDPPAVLFDIPDMTDTSPLLWNDGGRIWLFWGHGYEDKGVGYPGSPFCVTVSEDSGATWSAPRVAMPVGPVGEFTPQPVSHAFRGADGAIYVPGDSNGATQWGSLLWVSRDEGETWFDTGGRTGGRHSQIVLRRDGTFFGMSGKGSNAGGHMTEVVSADGGRSWSSAPSPFPVQANEQRCSLIRLASGRLLYAGDYRASLYEEGQPRPEGLDLYGFDPGADASFVTLSEDDGRSWSPWKRLPGVSTLCYSVARQAGDGTIHLLTSRPGQLFSFNESWVLET